MFQKEIILNSKSDDIKELGVTVELQYRLNFDADKICGFSHVFMTSQKGEDEIFEIYKEYYECALTEKEVMDRFRDLISDIKEGRLTVSF